MSVYTGQKTCNALYKPQYNTYKQIFLHRHIFKSDLCLFYSCMYVTFNIRAVWLSVPQSSKYPALHTICISPVVLWFTKGQVPAQRPLRPSPDLLTPSGCTCAGLFLYSTLSTLRATTCRANPLTQRSMYTFCKKCARVHVHGYE